MAKVPPLRWTDRDGKRFYRDPERPEHPYDGRMPGNGVSAEYWLNAADQTPDRLYRDRFRLLAREIEYAEADDTRRAEMNIEDLKEAGLPLPAKKVEVKSSTKDKVANVSINLVIVVVALVVLVFVGALFLELEKRNDHDGQTCVSWSYDEHGTSCDDWEDLRPDD